MKAGTNTLRATVAALLIAGGMGTLAPAQAADGADAVRGYVTDGNGNPISDAADNCVGEASMPEGAARKCGAAAPVAEPGKDRSSSET